MRSGCGPGAVGGLCQSCHETPPGGSTGDRAAVVEWPSSPRCTAELSPACSGMPRTRRAPRSPAMPVLSGFRRGACSQGDRRAGPDPAHTRHRGRDLMNLSRDAELSREAAAHFHHRAAVTYDLRLRESFIGLAMDTSGSRRFSAQGPGWSWSARTGTIRRRAPRDSRTARRHSQIFAQVGLKLAHINGLHSLIIRPSWSFREQELALCFSVPMWFIT